MRLADQWDGIERRFPADWASARLALSVQPEQFDRAAALLGPLGPGRAGRELRFVCARRGVGPGPDAVRRALQRLDRERISGELQLLDEPRAVESDDGRTPAATRTERERWPESLAAEWDAAVAVLPDDWSDVYAEVEVRSSDHLERAALLMSPLNPARAGGRTNLRFRCAHGFGYGASPGMVRRCFERLDTDRITGRVEILRALSDTDPVGTQGPVWYVGGKAV